MASTCLGVLRNMGRRKNVGADILATPLSRCLSTFDLTCLGIGYMIGPGIYVVTGTVVRTIAGPAAVLSYFLAGLAATLSALCYAEFGCRVPLAGSAYTYTYVCMGEFWAFTIGWNLVLEYLIAVASSAKAWSATLDAMCNGTISAGVESIFGTLESAWLSPNLDLVAVGVILVAIVFIIAGAKASARANNVLTALIVLFIAFITVYGFTFAQLKFWTNSAYGGFAPFGWSGVFAGAATCFYSYLGFDGIAVAGEETRKPAKSIPMATGISMVVVTGLYVLATASLTLMAPFYAVDTMAPFPVAFQEQGVMWAMYVASFGGLLGITTSITGGLYFLPRIIYSMAGDGLFFACFANVWARTQTPALAVVFFGMLAALISAVINLGVLVELMSIGTLISFTFVSASVLILRFREPCVRENIPLLLAKQAGHTDSCDNNHIHGKQCDPPEAKPRGQHINGTTKANSNPEYPSRKEEAVGEPTCCACNGSRCCSAAGPIRRFIYARLIPRFGGQEPLAMITVFVLSVAMALGIIMVTFDSSLATAQWWAVLIFVILIAIIALCLVVLHNMNQTNVPDAFKVPCVPWLPALSILVNLAMVLHLNYLTWIRVAVWMFIGSIIYFLYGMRNSKEKNLPSRGTGSSTSGRLPLDGGSARVRSSSSLAHSELQDSIDTLVYDVIE